MSFALDIQRFAERAKEKADEAVGIIMVQIAAELDFRSPVGDGKYWKRPPPAGYVGGRFRANWQLGIGAPDRTQTANIDTSPKNRTTGGTTTARISALIPDDAAGRVYYLSNNLPYAIPLEYGHSSQAPGPGGVVGLTVSRFQAIVRDAVAQMS